MDVGGDWGVRRGGAAPAKVNVTVDDESFS